MSRHDPVPGSASDPTTPGAPGRPWIGPFVGRPVSRRAVLAGGAATLLLAACSSGSSDETSDTMAAPAASLLALFTLNDYITAGVPQRVAFALTDPEGGLAQEGPASLAFTVTDPDGAVTSHDVQARSTGLPYAYYPIRFTPSKAGNFTVATEVDGAEATSTFTVGAEGSSEVPGPTDPMPAMASPTVDDHLGLDPICTQNPVCDLHATSLADALEAGRPVVYLVATPKFCTTGICGPVLDVLETVVADYGDRVTFIHQEVYRSATDAAEKGGAATLAEQVEALHLLSEPVLFVTDAEGTVRHRLDTAYDRSELTESLDDVLA